MSTRSSGDFNERKGKKSSSGKSRLPQRGLGVEQLEKMRLRNQMGLYQFPSFFSPLIINPQEQDIQTDLPRVSSLSPSSSSTSSAFGYIPRNMIRMSDYEATERRYDNSLSEEGTRRIYNRHLFQSNLQLPLEKRPRHGQTLMTNSGNDFPDSEEVHGIDLDLKLSL